MAPRWALDVPVWVVLMAGVRRCEAQWRNEQRRQREGGNGQ
jgi:hypothetical protein